MVPFNTLITVRICSLPHDLFSGAAMHSGNDQKLLQNAIWAVWQAFQPMGLC
jgi:hypothetical protein